MQKNIWKTRVILLLIRIKYAEIDIIAKNREEIVFIEVKTRIGERFGIPEDALNRDKMRRLVKNANMYAVRKGINIYRIDAICIVLNQDKKLKRINHYKNIIG